MVDLSQILLNTFSNKVEKSDDIQILPKNILPIFKNPYRAFGLDNTTVTTANKSKYIQTLRDVLRRACLAHSHYFSGLNLPKLSLIQLLVAYHIIRGTINGESAKDVLEALHSSPHIVGFKATDILPLLKPLHGGVVGECPKEYRGFRMLAVTFKEVRRVPTIYSIYGYKIVFTFTVHYCMRLHTIDRDLDSLRGLNELLKHESLTVPVFPELNVLESIGIAELSTIGRKLAKYMNRVHSMAADMDKFSSRLLKFLNVDFEKVQSEEEGAYMAILDTTTNPKNTVWHIIDENWLLKWRRFAMGRGPRRYLPPGPITNLELLIESKKSGRRTLEISKHYRCVNYNVWRFLEIVHGGGPCISRKEEDIYSSFGYSQLQAVIKIQTRMRIYLSKMRKYYLQMIQLSRRQTGRAIIIEETIKEIKKSIDDKIRLEELSRTKDKLIKAITFTQSVWRKKKNFVPEENLEKIKNDQEVFARARAAATANDISATEELVVLDLQPIVKIGSTNIYITTIPEEISKLPFRTQRLPGSETAIIAETDNDALFTLNSKILSINSYPVAALTYEQVKQRLESASWPLVLELEKPMKAEQVPSVDALFAIKEKQLQYNAFKILLANGIQLIKHNSKYSSHHLTTIRITDKDIFYQSKYDPQKRENELWHRLSLFNLKYVLAPNRRNNKEPHESETIQSRKRKINANYSFELVAEDRSLILEYPHESLRLKLQTIIDKHKNDNAKEDAVVNRKISNEKNIAMMKKIKAKNLVDSGLSDEEYHMKKVDILVENFRALIYEIKSSQIYVDKDGLPLKRVTAKSTLRKLVN